MIAVVDFGSGNTRSMLRALAAVGTDARLVQRADDLLAADRIVLPGVGAAGSAVSQLRRAGLWEPARRRAMEGTPFLGVCLGAQLMLEGSDEDDARGLGLFPGRARAFPDPAQGGPRTVPHIGWNAVETPDGRRHDAYFVHGFWLDAADPAVVAATTEVEGVRFPAILRRGHLTATQFHPEKSGSFGRALLSAFAAGMLDGNAVDGVGAWT